MSQSSHTSTSTPSKSLLAGWNTLPNWVTYSRLVLMIVFVMLTLKAGPCGITNVGLRLVATLVFMVTAMTDKLDGYLARRTNTVTELGKLLDPIADKLLVISALFMLSCFGELRWWITGLFIARELIITIMRFLVVHRKGIVIPASKSGKYKTFMQCVGITLLLFPAWHFAVTPFVTTWQRIYYCFAYACIGVALFYCLYSGGLYVYHAFNRHESTHEARS